ncbi:MAG: NHL repeat-containing protein [Flavobacteriaceae bacterium]|nr:NHL repeat-containing protein [Flavobacteriaceae bacterium]
MKKLVLIFLTALLVFSCKQQEETPKEWVLKEVIEPAGVNPIGIAFLENAMWLSDGDHNRLVQIDDAGTIVQAIDSLERPMHIDVKDGALYVPEYGTDQIRIIKNGEKSFLPISDSLDAPAGIAIYKNEMAIADFYNNRILYSKDGTSWMSFGKEGQAEGEFYYPTDVHITTDKIWVADAYNNRIQVFDKAGAFLQEIGKDQKMNAATGIFVSNDEVFITDFENDRILIFDWEGNLKQELSDGIEKPTDITVHNEILYTINYRNGKIQTYKMQ